MECVNCRYPDSRVVSTRHGSDGIAINRRRECVRCGTRYTTEEYPKKRAGEHDIRNTTYRILPP